MPGDNERKTLALDIETKRDALAPVEIRRDAMLKQFVSDADASPEEVMRELLVIARMQLFTGIEMGKRLVWLREKVEEGRWIEFLKELKPLGVCQRTACRYMKMAQIVAHFPQLNGTEQAKMTALAEATDEELGVLAQGGMLAKSDEERMTRKELEQELRQARERLEHGKEHVRKKDRRIAELEEELKGGAAGGAERPWEGDCRAVAKYAANLLGHDIPKGDAEAAERWSKILGATLDQVIDRLNVRGPAKSWKQRAVAEHEEEHGRKEDHDKKHSK